MVTKFAEFHRQSALRIIQDYNQAGAGQVQRVVDIHEAMRSQDQDPTHRNISRNLSKTQRADLPTDLIRQIVSALDKLKSQRNLFDLNDDGKVKSAAMVGGMITTHSVGIAVMIPTNHTNKSQDAWGFIGTHEDTSRL